MDVNELTRRYNTAAQRVQDAADAVEHAEDGTDVAPLQRDLDDAITAAEHARSVLRDAEERAAARSRFQPVPQDDSDADVTRGVVTVGDEELVYRPDVRRSFFSDLMRARVGGDSQAAERIGRHDAQMRDITTAAGADGVLPPQYLSSLYVDLIREGRPVANVLSGPPLPDTGMTLTIPRLASGVAVAAQASENSAVQETDADTDQLSVPVRTVAGMQDVSRQAVDRTDPAFDRIIMGDLVAAYDEELDRQVIAADGSSGTHTGLLSVGSPVAVTYTDASPTAVELLPKGYDALQQMWAAIKRGATHVVMSPRRAAWLAAATSAETPVFPQTVTAGGRVGEQTSGFIMSFAGVPVIVDGNIPTTLGGGTEDAIIFLCAPQIPLFEGPLNMAVETSPGANTLTVRFVAYAYSAFAGNRRAKAIAKITGTGLAAPTF